MASLHTDGRGKVHENHIQIIWPQYPKQVNDPKREQFNFLEWKRALAITHRISSAFVIYIFMYAVGIMAAGWDLLLTAFIDLFAVRASQLHIALPTASLSYTAYHIRHVNVRLDYPDRRSPALCCSPPTKRHIQKQTRTHTMHIKSTHNIEIDNYTNGHDI